MAHETPWPVLRLPRNAVRTRTLRILSYNEGEPHELESNSCQTAGAIDESGLNIAMTRHYGPAVRAQRVHDAVPKNFGRNITILGALSLYGLDGVMTVEGATEAEVFRAYVSRVLAPTLRPGDVVVMDTLSSHNVAGIDNAITSTGAKLIYLPPYSPDWSPIEPWGSAIKTSRSKAIPADHHAVFIGEDDECMRHMVLPPRNRFEPLLLASRPPLTVWLPFLNTRLFLLRTRGFRRLTKSSQPHAEGRSSPPSVRHMGA
jgi:transposase